MSKIVLADGEESFEVTSILPDKPTHIVLFAVGGGGNPERHLPLLTALAERGCAVIAPHFERFVSPRPTEDMLLLRARRLRLALDHVARTNVPVVGVGHSIGAAMLLALAGGEVWMRPGQPLAIPIDERLQRIVLMAPATGFFQVPGSLDAVQIPILAFAGTNDTMCTPEQVTSLQRLLGDRALFEMRLLEGAGHFSFMHVLPPQATEPHADRDVFLANLTADVIRFVVG